MPADTPALPIPHVSRHGCAYDLVCFVARCVSLFRHRRGHHSLWRGTDQAVGDRCARNAGPLPPRTPVCAGQSNGEQSIAGACIGIGLAADPAGRHRPLRAHVGDNQRGWSRPVMLAAVARTGDLQAAVGRWRSREEALPCGNPGLDSLWACTKCEVARLHEEALCDLERRHA